MFLLSLLTNKDSYNTQIIQCVNNTIFRKRFQVPGFGTGSETLEPVPWNRFLRQITILYAYIVTVYFAFDKVLLKNFTTTATTTTTTTTVN